MPDFWDVCLLHGALLRTLVTMLLGDTFGDGEGESVFTAILEIGD